MNDGFQGWTAAGGVLKPIAPRQQHPAAVMAAPRAVPSLPRAVQAEPQAAQPHAAVVKKEPKAVVRPDVHVPVAEPLQLLVAAAAKAPEELAPAFVPRHSRKKVNKLHSPFACLCSPDCVHIAPVPT